MSAIQNSSLFLAFDSQSTSFLFDRSARGVATTPDQSARQAPASASVSAATSVAAAAATNWTSDAVSSSSLDAPAVSAAVSESTMGELRQLRKFLDDTDWMYDDVVHLAALDHPAASDAAAVRAPVAKASQKRVGGR